jgi:hypothetical protein
MKNYLVVLIFCLITGIGYGQYISGTLKTEVNGSSVTIRIDSTWRNCGSQYDQQIFFVGNTITWLQVDWGWTYGCSCLFDYSVSLDSLRNGNYTVVVYFTYVNNPLIWDTATGQWVYGHIPCDTTYQGATTFTINNSGTDNPVKVGSYASSCMVGIPEHHDAGIIQPYPNPTYDLINIPNFGTDKSVELSDVMGHPVKSKVSLSSGNTVTLDLTGLPAGIYYCRNAGKVYKVIKL